MKELESITNVIGTEVYVYYPDDAYQRVIDVIDSLLELAGDKRDALDLFDVVMRPSSYYYEEYREAYEREEIDNAEWPENPQDSDVRRFIETGHRDYSNWQDYPYPKWDGVEVTAKDPKNSRLAKKITGILDMCSYEGSRDS